jgi:hypothetical protein
MRIHITLLTRQRITLLVAATDRIRDVKAIIETEEGIPASKQLLFFSERELKDEPTLQDYSIENHANLALLRRRDGMQISIKLCSDTYLRVSVEQTDHVEDLKDVLECIIGVPHGQQRVGFAGRQLEDGNTLGHYGIKEESTLCLWLRLRG